MRYYPVLFPAEATRWQWQPKITEHNPRPPIELENRIVPRSLSEARKIVLAEEHKWSDE